MKVGVFDSGIGGMTIAQAIKEGLSTAAVVFFADTAGFPYNDKKATEIRERFLRACVFFEKEGCSIVVIACNTASVLAYETAKEKFDGRLRMFSIVDLTIAALFESPLPKKIIGIIGTVHTINSGCYENKMQDLLPNIVIKSLFTPELAPLSEEYFLSEDKPKLDLHVLYDYLNDRKLSDIDTLLLGCTHYPIIMEEIKKIYNGKVQIIDAIEKTKNTLGNLFSNQRRVTELRDPSHIAYASKLTDVFVKASAHFLGKHVKTAEVRI